MSDKKVVSLISGGKPSAQPNESVITFLERLLDEALKGDVQEVICTYCIGDSIYNITVGDCQKPHVMHSMLWDNALYYRDLRINNNYEE